MYEKSVAAPYSISDFWGYPSDGSWAPKTQDFGNVALPEPGSNKQSAEAKEVTSQVTQSKGTSKVPLVMLGVVGLGLYVLSKV